MNHFPPGRYTSYTESDFIADTFFQEWVTGNNSEYNQFWSDFQNNHPDKREAIENARLFLERLRFQEHLPTEAQIESRYREHLTQIKEIEKAPVFRLNKISAKSWIGIAASFAALISLSILFFQVNKHRTEQVSVTSAFGEIKKVMLPDSSFIVLNGNSKIRFNWHKGENKPREVWLEGEAFFDVRHLNRDKENIKANEKFLVHGTGFTIEVLGTEFDVRQRRNKTEVVLQNGKIKFSLVDSSAHEIIMRPGDLIAFDNTTKKIHRSATIPANYVAWKEKRLVLDNPTLEEIANYLEDNYGKKIVIENAEMKRDKIEGPILIDNLDDALFIISTVLNTRIQYNDSTHIVISSK